MSGCVPRSHPDRVEGFCVGGRSFHLSTYRGDMLNRPEHVKESESWEQPDSFVSRVARLVSSPYGAGLLVFGASIIITVALILMRPSGAIIPSAEPSEENNLTGIAMETSPTGEPDEVVVYVSGEVQQPGLVTLPQGTRVADAIEAAGDLTEEAQIEGVNVARLLVDGEHIHIGDGEDESPNSPEETVSSGSGLVNLNQADQATLETLPRIGPAIASRIIDWRETNGGFRTVQDLQQVSGIGPKVFAELETLVTAP